MLLSRCKAIVGAATISFVRLLWLFVGFGFDLPCGDIPGILSPNSPLFLHQLPSIVRLDRWRGDDCRCGWIDGHQGEEQSEPGRSRHPETRLLLSDNSGFIVVVRPIDADLANDLGDGNIAHNSSWPRCCVIHHGAVWQIYPCSLPILGADQLSSIARPRKPNTEQDSWDWFR